MSDIVVADLIRVYKMGKVEVIALRGLDATFPGGKVTWIRGPSGCGKTTLLNLVGGVDRPTAGSITMDGSNLAHLSDAELVAYRREKVGFVFQFFNLVPVLTAAENVDLPMRLKGTQGVDRDARVKELLEAVGLTGKGAHTDPRRGPPPPPEMASRERGKTVLLVSHDPHATAIADVTMDMADG